MDRNEPANQAALVNDCSRSVLRFLPHAGFTAALTLGVAWLSQGNGSAASASAFPPFSIQRQGEVSWLVRPDGQRFFSLGVCVVSQGATRAEYHPANPGYAAWQHYSDSNEWAQATLARLKN